MWFVIDFVDILGQFDCKLIEGLAFQYSESCRLKLILHIICLLDILLCHLNSTILAEGTHRN